MVNGERLKSAAGVNYTYDRDDRRVVKSNGRLYWYGGGSDPIAETDTAGNNPVEYVFFGRVAHPCPISGQGWDASIS